LSLPGYPLLGRYPPAVILLNTEPVGEALHALDRRGVRHAPIVDSERKLVGLVTIDTLVDFIAGAKHREIVEGVFGGDLARAFRETLIDRVMYPNPPYAVLGRTGLDEVLEVFTKGKSTALPVTLPDKTVVGIITTKHFVDMIHTGNIYVSVAEVMRRETHAMPTTSTVLDVAREMSEHRVRHIPLVSDENRVEGIVSARDIVRYFASEDVEEMMERGELDAVYSTPAMAIATRNLVTVGPNKDVSRALREMQRHGISSVLVVEDGVLRGIVTDKDIVERLPARIGVDMFIDTLKAAIVFARLYA